MLDRLLVGSGTASSSTQVQALHPAHGRSDFGAQVLAPKVALAPVHELRAGRAKRPSSRSKIRPASGIN